MGAQSGTPCLSWFSAHAIGTGQASAQPLWEGGNWVLFIKVRQMCVIQMCAKRPSTSVGSTLQIFGLDQRKKLRAGHPLKLFS